MSNHENCQSAHRHSIKKPSPRRIFVWLASPRPKTMSSHSMCRSRYSKTTTALSMRRSRIRGAAKAATVLLADWYLSARSGMSSFRPRTAGRCSVSLAPGGELEWSWLTHFVLTKATSRNVDSRWRKWHGSTNVVSESSSIWAPT